MVKEACKVFYKKNENLILTAVFLLILVLVTVLRYDYYYDLNDDVLIKDITAGVYTGEPESHNIQMLYLISGFISLLYRIIPQWPWYGWFLCICQFGSMGLIVNRSLSFSGKTRNKILLLMLEGAIVMGTMLEHLVFVQYTITCTMLAAAAAFLFFTTDIGLDNRSFFRKNIPAMVLVFIACLIRSEMLLLVLPMICAAGVCKWGSEEVIFTKAHAVKYFTVLGGIFAGLCLGQFSNTIAYSSPEWQKFTLYFDNRTELYDYQSIPEYSQATAFYESVGLTESEVKLFHNYNFGLDEEIDEKLVGEIAAYAASVRKEEKSFTERLIEKGKGYIYRLKPYGAGEDFPRNALIIAGYVMLLIMGGTGRKFWNMCWKLMLLFAVRTGLWMFILMGDRYPPRITHSLYYMELCILCAMLLIESVRLRQAAAGGNHVAAGSWKNRNLVAMAGVILLLAAAVNIPQMIHSTDKQYAAREIINLPYDAMRYYCKSDINKNNYYFVDVYSTVEYSEKIFAGVDNGITNYDIMGGWACKSPLYRKKLEAFGLPHMEEALVTWDNVYMIVEFDNVDGGLDWLREYYRGHGREIVITQVDSIADTMGVYKINEAS